MVLVLLAGCGQLAFLNAPPSVRVLSPESGTLVSHSGEVELVVEVDDDYDPIEDLELSWSLADGTVLTGEWTLDAEASTATFRTTGQLPKGEPTLTVRVVDQLGESDAAEVQLLVFDDLPPTIGWTTPAEGASYAGGVPLAVSLTITDPDPLADTSLALTWSGSAAEGADDLPAAMAESGELSFTLAPLAITHWTLGLTVVDALGASATSTVGFDVVNGDRDNDGHLDEALGGDDCDDTSGGIHPGATERCNAIDDDCDGFADEEATDAPTWYADTDGDTYGDAESPYAACEAPAGRVADDTDCDDTDAEVHPGAPERCNHADEDCDGEDDDEATDQQTVYLDYDEDGYGAGEAYTTCFPADDEVATGGDCDDGDPDANPGAAEVCDVANTDEDCDGLAEDDDADSTGRTDAWADADGDNRGDPAGYEARCDLGSAYADNADDCDDGDASMWTDRAEVCEDGADYDCDGADPQCTLSGSVDLGLADATLTGDAYAALGFAFAPLGDVDGDGNDDFAVSALLGSEVYLVRGAGLGDGAASAWPTLTDAAGATALGEGLAGVGDVDGDGVPDLLVGAPDTDTGAGAVWLFSGGLAADVDTTAAQAGRAGSAGELLGSSVAGLGDFDGDGAAKEALVAAEGSVWVLDASLGSEAQWALAGTRSPELALAPDVDGDGLDDAWVGEPDEDAVYLVPGGTSGALSLPADAEVVYTAVSSGDRAGAAVAGLGDLNGDGLGDLAAGAPDSDAAGAGAGEAYVVFGATTWVDSAFDRADARIAGGGAGDALGLAVAAVGDADGDGLADLTVGAPYADGGGTNSGGAWLFYGSASFGSTDVSAADVTFVGESASDNAGEAVGRVGDLNGDGFADVAVGAPSAAGDGRAYLIYGGGG